MTAYESMTCRECGETVVPKVFQVHRPKTAKKYDDCYFQCRCGRGYSNAKHEKERRIIFRQWQDNIPRETHDGFLEVINQALNITNRNSKRERLAFETSEDAVIVSLPDVLIFIEAKYTSRNDCRPNYVNFRKYLNPDRRLFAKPASDVAADGYYELVRNWVAGSLLAQSVNKRFNLINLAPSNCHQSAKHFAQSLNLGESKRFEFCTWAETLARLRAPHEPWFAQYAMERRLEND